MFQKIIEPFYLDQAVREQLAKSLAYIFETFAERFKTDTTYCSEVLNKICTQPVSPKVFARYFDLVFAINEQNFNHAERLWQEILILAGENVQFAIIPYQHAILEDDYERFPRLVFSSYSQTPPLSPPSQSLYEGHVLKLNQALEIIKAVDFSIYQEIQALIFQVIVTASHSASKATPTYAGASSLMTWGAVFINADAYASLYQVVEFYVHEVTHCVLFGYSSDGALVLNPLSESYQSPLRTDPRPMDGIYHATLVCARLALFMEKWLNASIDIKDADWLKHQHNFYLQRFSDGRQVIEQHAKLSGKGQELFDMAKASLTHHF